MEAQIFDVPYQAHITPEPARVWSPLDRLHGHIQVTGGSVQTVSVSLLGHIRVWMLLSRLREPPNISSTSCKFLHQTANVGDAVTADTINVARLSNASFTLTIPRWCIPKVGGVPDQCLSLPPTMITGDILRDRDQEEHAQPRIKYTLQAIVRSREGVTVVAQKEIIVIPRPEPSPPINTADFPDEFITMAVAPMRFSLFRRQYRMTISMPEPRPISLTHLKELDKGQIDLHIAIRTLYREADGDALPRLSGSLNFTLQPGLRAKTFYSLKPFPQTPSQNLVGLKIASHLHDSILKLPAQSLNVHSWEQQFFDVPVSPIVNAASSASSTSSCNGPREHEGALEAWIARLVYPIHIEHALLPTFCSAIASRQYSIIGRVRVKGVQVQEFVLECPLQVNCSLTGATLLPVFREEYRSDFEEPPHLRSGQQDEAFESTVTLSMDQHDPPAYTEA